MNATNAKARDGRCPQHFGRRRVVPFQEFLQRGRNQSSVLATLQHDDDRSGAMCWNTRSNQFWEELIEDFGAEPRATCNKAGIASSTSHRVRNDWAGHFRPGFSIIGEGKCGSSVRSVLCFASAFTPVFVVAPNATLQSLYHYLTEHPRVLPASEKQIHYFKVRATQKVPNTYSPVPLLQYYSTCPMKWFFFLHHFPTTTSFLASGALMTGEASPGYLPYFDVVRRIHSRLHSRQTKWAEPLRTRGLELSV